jgi:hypothetical protein
MMRGMFMYAVEMPSCGMTYLLTFMKIGTGVQKILRFYLSNLDGRNVGITNGMELWSAPLRLAQVA